MALLLLLLPLDLWLLALAPLLAEANDCTCVPDKFCSAGPPQPSDSCAPGEVCCPAPAAGGGDDGLESRWGYGGWSWPSQAGRVNNNNNKLQGNGGWWGNNNAVVRPQQPPGPSRRPTNVLPGAGARPAVKQDVITSHRNAKLLPLSSCGTQSKRNIVNGQDAGVGAYTWLALITYVSRSGERLNLCAGALINSRYVLTAAHCFKDLQRKGLRVESVVLGEYDVRQDPDCDQDQVCSSKQDVKVDRVIQHPQYQSAGDINDIALVRLAQDVKFTGVISPLCLPYSDVTNEENSFVAGWGKTEDGVDSPVKLYIQIPVVNDTYCRDIFKRNYSRTINSQVHFCAGGGADERDSCNGDSGGPLMTIQRDSTGRTNRFVALGIVSFGPKKCGERGVPGVYTRVFNYVPWILDQLQS